MQRMQSDVAAYRLLLLLLLLLTGVGHIEEALGSLGKAGHTLREGDTHQLLHNRRENVRRHAP